MLYFSIRERKGSGADWLFTVGRRRLRIVFDVLEDVNITYYVWMLGTEADVFSNSVMNCLLLQSTL